MATNNIVDSLLISSTLEVSDTVTFSGTSDFIISSTGNVGIGVATPSTKLEVSGVITATGGTSTNWNTAYGWGDHAAVGYLTSFTETDPVFSASAAAGITSTNISNWNTAYGWGDHASAGYLTSYSETDTLSTVTTRGSSTTNSITVGPELWVGSNISTASAFVQLGNGRTGSGYAYLDLVGDTTYTDYGLRVIRYNTGANAASDIVHRGTGQLSIISNEAAPILFKTSAAERMRITSVGNVGIGTTSPDARLSINTAAGQEGIKIRNVNSIDTFHLGHLGTEDSYLQMKNNAGTVEVLLRTDNGSSYINTGNVGIGTTSPAAKLHVSDISTDILTESTTGAARNILKSSTGEWRLGTNAGQSNNFWIYEPITAQYVFNINTSGNVGIGTTSPSYALDIERATGEVAIQLQARDNTSNTAIYFGDNNDADVGSLIYNQGSNYMSFTANAGERMRITNAGNVGIGTTSPGAKLDVKNGGETIRITGSTTGNAFTGWVSFVDSAGTRHGYVGYGSSGDDNLIINSDGGSLRLRAGNTDTAYVTSAGIGIGTASPAQKLHVDQGFIRVQSPDVGGVTPPYAQIGQLSNAYQAGISSYYHLTMQAGGSGNIYFTEDGNYLMTLSNAGNLGIGTTSPDRKLHVYQGDSGVTGYALTNGIDIESTSISGINILSPDTGNGRIYFGSPSSSTSGAVEYVHSATLSSAYMKFRAGNAERMRIDGSGKVGIGTTSPSTNLQTGDGSAGVDTSIRAYHSDGAYTEIRGYGLITNRTTAYIRPTGDKNAVMAIGNDNNTWNYVNVNANYFVVATDTTEHMRVTSAGDVGIGTASPSGKLHIKTNASSEFIFTGSSTSGYATTLHMDDTGLDIGHNSTSRSLNLKTGSLDRLTITGGGNVGIGTTSPGSKLTVVDAGNSLTFSQHSTSNVAELKIIADAAHDAAIYFGDTVDNVRGGFYYDTSANQLQVRGYNNGTRMVVNSNGNVGIGTTSPSEKLEVSGNILASGDVTAFSDARLKENVETLPNALESVKAMRGVTYNKIGEEKQSIGVIAQEVQAVLPQLVSEHKDEMLSVAYGNITAVLIEAIKEQQEQIDELKAIINGLTK